MRREEAEVAARIREIRAGLQDDGSLSRLAERRGVRGVGPVERAAGAALAGEIVERPPARLEEPPHSKPVGRMFAR